MDRNALDQLQNSTVFATDGDKIGSVGQVYLDDVTNEPTFVTVKTGLFGARETFVPLQQAQTTTDGITVPFEKSFVKEPRTWTKENSSWTATLSTSCRTPPSSPPTATRSAPSVRS
ncbi:PRC-barrel domain-containing protein, partial [Corynebacterium diphtheriae]